ncbi:MAG: hypothetical protein MK078_05685 [Crocinitomicaceae bacterium]|nr:hypothetical protein [Crocinitomicaceae bacterium]
MIQKFLLILSLLLLQGCFVADAIFLDSYDETESLQKRSEDAVYNYLLMEFGWDYTPYGYSEITIFKPKQIAERDSLIEVYNRTQDQKTRKSIESISDTINKYGIERTVSLTHFYLVEDSSNTFDVYEGVFTLSDTLTVKGYKPTLYKELDDSKRTILYNFFFEQTIFVARSYSESANLSQSFYAFYKSRLESFDLMTDKSNFLEHSLIITELVKKIGDYKPHEIAKQLISTKLKIELGKENYIPAQWSVLNEVSSEEAGLQGYYFFHKFTTLDASPGDTTVKVFEFDPFLQLNSEIVMGKPYNQYFE